jgi:hypothetical protein
VIRRLYSTFLVVLFLFSCTKKTPSANEASVGITDGAYLSAAESHLAHTKIFGPATNITTAHIKKIQFHNDMAIYDGSRTAEIPTLRKDFIVNSANTLMVLKRTLPSRKDETSMQVHMYSGLNKSILAGSRSRARAHDYCDRIAFNAVGEGACLIADSSGYISVVRMSPKYGHRLISSGLDYTTSIATYKANKQFSRKNIEKGTGNIIDLVPIRVQP